MQKKLFGIAAVTAVAGRGFSTSGAFFYDGYGHYWIAGNGAEHPDREG